AAAAWRMPRQRASRRYFAVARVASVGVPLPPCSVLWPVPSPPLLHSWKQPSASLLQQVPCSLQSPCGIPRLLRPPRLSSAGVTSPCLDDVSDILLDSYHPCRSLEISSSVYPGALT